MTTDTLKRLEEIAERLAIPPLYTPKDDLGWLLTELRKALAVNQKQPTRANFRNLVEALELTEQDLKNSLQNVQHALSRFKTLSDLAKIEGGE